MKKKNKNKKVIRPTNSSDIINSQRVSESNGNLNNINKCKLFINVMSS